MRLESSIVIHKTPEEIWAFLGNLENVPKWDRGVAAVRQISQAPQGVGMEFQTLGYGEGTNEVKAGRMSYRITKADPVEGCTVALTSADGNARFFKTASWNFRVMPTTGGSLLVCVAEFTLRLRYLFLGPIFYAKKSAIQFDLRGLKQALEQISLAQTS